MLLQDTVRIQAERRPDAVAVVFQGQTATYQQLEQRSNQLARVLVESGCRPGDRVGLLVPKSIQAIVGMLGTLKAGCIYVPMDSSSPPARQAKIVHACEPAFILSATPAAQQLQALMTELVAGATFRTGWLDSGPPDHPGPDFNVDQIASMPTGPIPCATKSEDVAHILFTSGSTGVPKGVMITHANASHFIQWAVRYFNTLPSDRISGHPPLHFDLSTFDIWGTFLAGAQLHPVSPEISLLPHKLAAFIRDSELTQWFSVPSALKYMAQFDVVKPGGFPALKRLLWCGEALPAPTLIYLMQRLPGVQFTNLYGPTETTIASSYYTVPECPQDDHTEIPIGLACEGEQLFVLDESLQTAPAGEIGDLFISGAGLSPGYWRDLQKTESVFIHHREHGRIYRTGDLARTGQDGLVYLLGRADSQIKSRGFRIELGEIETALNTLGLLRECAVVGVRTDGFEGTAICCAYSPVPGVQVTPGNLRERLMQLLPSYMIPNQWLSFDSLPLNGNGKVDRPRLRECFTAAKSAA